MSFELPNALQLLITNKPEAFHGERAIRLFQLRTWMYFSDDYEMVESAGMMSAAAFLHNVEKEFATKIPGMNFLRMSGHL